MFARAIRGLKQQVSTQVLSVATVALALFCLAGALLVLENAGALVRRWSAPARVTVFLADNAPAEQVDALRAVLASLPEVEDARHITAAEARASLARGDRTLGAAPVELFPATIELRLLPAAATEARVRLVAERVRRLPMVVEVETYRGFTERLRTLLGGGRTAAAAMAFAVLVCVFAVVSNTVRMSLAARTREIEVLRLVGATRSYVRAPFLLEGALLGGFGAAVALALLAVLYLASRASFEASLGAVLGIQPVFLSAWLLGAFLLGGSGVGVVGSAVALRRGLRS
ncbi:MAG: permease-like cell division protein FtsX [Polyangiales bacterium]